MTYKDVIIGILNGDCDDNFEDIANAMKDRRSILNRMKVMSFSVGDSVKFSQIARPLSLVGATGKIKSINNKTVVIDLDNPRGLYDKNVKTPVDLIEKV